MANFLSAAGPQLIRQSEGFRDRVYNDVAGNPTIGYGHLVRPNESFPNGITEDQANSILDEDALLADADTKWAQISANADAAIAADKMTS